MISEEKTKVQMTPLELLQWIHFGLTKGNPAGAIALLENAIEQLKKSEAEEKGEEKKP